MSEFLSEKFHFLVVKFSFSLYLNKHVFVIWHVDHVKPHDIGNLTNALRNGTRHDLCTYLITANACPSLLCALVHSHDLATSDGPDQPEQMCRLIRTCPVRICIRPFLRDAVDFCIKTFFILKLRYRNLCGFFWLLAVTLTLSMLGKNVQQTTMGFFPIFLK